MPRLPALAVPLAILALAFGGWRAAGLQGLLLVGGGVLLWALLHFTRLVNVMQRAARNPIGHVGSAVMLNARLRAGVPLVHVVALARALGESLHAGEGAQPEVYRWSDAGGSCVTCEFEQGRLARWRLERPTPACPP
ncbi:glycerate kinase [Melaminivora sp.]|uniref:glycerate kinase n=1 Tax=Melaminivora sp. TaxID=1933032 RepID=UPI0028AC9D6B|nr:glycerate kinase [Melaminivora sp.]